LPINGERWKEQLRTRAREVARCHACSSLSSQSRSVAPSVDLNHEICSRYRGVSRIHQYLCDAVDRPTKKDVFAVIKTPLIPP
jgi:hypothetical protein